MFILHIILQWLNKKLYILLQIRQLFLHLHLCLLRLIRNQKLKKIKVAKVCTNRKTGGWKGQILFNFPVVRSALEELSRTKAQKSNPFAKPKMWGVNMHSNLLFMTLFCRFVRIGSAVASKIMSKYGWEEGKGAVTQLNPLSTLCLQSVMYMYIYIQGVSSLHSLASSSCAWMPVT